VKLPLLISVPHAGLEIPPEVVDICLLSQNDIMADSDEGACDIYYGLEKYCRTFLSTDIARAIIDLNRPPDDLGGDGVIKSHTCWNVPVYKKFPDKKLISILLESYYFPYHKRLKTVSSDHSVRLGVDCHTMSAVGPPVGPDPGRTRPLVCLSNADGTCPREWILNLAGCLSEAYREKVSINVPFQGGYITRSHAAEMPWLQIEISRTDSYSVTFKRDGLLEGLHRFCHTYMN